MKALSRRSLLKGTLGLPLLGLGGTLSFLARPINAEPVTTTIALVNMTLALSRLFSSSGSSVSDLLRLQTQMLQTISAQIVVVQKGIEQILQQLDEIQAMIGHLPAEVVTELYRRRIHALLGTYEEIMMTYKADVDSVGLDEAQKNNAKEFKTMLLDPLRVARDDLFTAPAYVNVPILSAALHMEVHGMIMADYKKSKIHSALNRYKAWFDQALRGPGDSIEKRMTDLRQKRIKVQDELSKLGNRFDCVKDFQVEILGPDALVHLNIKTLTSNYQLMPIDLGENSESVKWLQGKGSLEAIDLPSCTIPGGPETDVTITMHKNTIMKSSHPDLFPVSAVVRDFDQCGAKQGPRWRAQEIGDLLTQTGYPLISLSALKTNCKDALSAIDKFSKEL